jgi:hypothetical protein
MQLAKLFSGPKLSQRAENVCLLHNQVFDAVELDLHSRLSAEQHTAIDIDVDGGGVGFPA